MIPPRAIACFRCETLDGDAYGRTCRTCEAVKRDEMRRHWADRFPEPSTLPDASRYTGRPRLVAGKPFGSE